MTERVGAVVPLRTGFDSFLSVVFPLFGKRAEPVEIIDLRFNFMPQGFRWRGDTWRVRRFVRVWDRAAAAWHPPRRYFHVICQGGRSYILVQNLRAGTWQLCA